MEALRDRPGLAAVGRTAIESRRRLLQCQTCAVCVAMPGSYKHTNSLRAPAATFLDNCKWPLLQTVDDDCIIILFTKRLHVLQATLP